MLDRLRDRAAHILADTHTCTLATTGPAGIQASIVRCAGSGITLYVLVPDTSDHLFNLEIEPEVVVTTQNWHLRGRAEFANAGEAPFTLNQLQWHTLIRVTPLRLHIQGDHEAVNHAETIDFDPQAQG